MTPSQQAKAEGLKGLTEVSEMSGVALSTLSDWHREKPRLFALVLRGCKVSLNTETKEERMNRIVRLIEEY